MTLIQRFLTGTYIVTRQQPGYYKEGIWQPGAVATIEVEGSMQPLNARELKLVSEGARLKQYYKFYSDKPLFVIGTKPLRAADTIAVNGETYKVYSVEPWEGTDLPYYKSIIYREPEQ